MKKSVLVVSLILLSFLLQTCREDESVSKGNVQFVFDVSASDNTGGRTMSEIPDGSLLRITIMASTWGGDYPGLIPIIKFGDHYLSEPIPLEPGSYDLVDFFVVTPSNQILYLTPQAGSPLSSLVEHPLPITFTVTENTITTSPIEVLSINSYGPEDFGYASFGVNIVPGELFKLAVFAPAENQTLEYSGVQAFVLHDDDTIFSKYLEPKVNSIVFESNPDDFYTLVLMEPSWKKYTRTFRVGDLQEELQGNPLSVNLNPALTLYINTLYQGNFEFNINTDNPTVKGDLQIDWGDGTYEDVSLPRTNEYSLNHVYGTDGHYFITVSGDLEAIEKFHNSYSPIEEISVKHLSELKELTIVTSTTQTIDISRNKKLESINFSMSRFTSLDVSKNTALKSISLDFNTNFEATSLNKLIHDKLQHAINYNLRNGGMNLKADFDPNGPLIGPPSAAAREELRTLRDDYGWYIYPENF